MATDRPQKNKIRGAAFGAGLSVTAVRLSYCKAPQWLEPTTPTSSHSQREIVTLAFLCLLALTRHSSDRSPPPSFLPHSSSVATPLYLHLIAVITVITICLSPPPPQHDCQTRSIAVVLPRWRVLRAMVSAAVRPCL